MLNALTLAKYIVTKCTTDHCPISNLQLQKILYYIQVYFLKNAGGPVFSDEIEAWKFGPAVPEVYYYFCGFGSMPIEIDYKTSLDINADAIKSIDCIVTDKREKEPWDLVEDTHAEGKPWKKIFGNGEGNKHVISTDLMRKYG